MAYNKAKAEQEWLRWKEAEEQQLRELGVDEDTIQRLHTYDWEAFNRERRYLQRWADWPPYPEQISDSEDELPVETPDSLLDSIENTSLFQLLSGVDKLTLQILFCKLQGFTSREIAEKIGLSESAVRQRISRLKRKF